MNVVLTALNEAKLLLNELINDEQQLQRIVDAGDLLVQAFKQNGRVYSCGNGGSHCDAMHFAEELSGRYRKNRRALGAAAISDPSHISCVGNDYGYEFIFSRYIEGHGRAGDVMVGISTSGTSKNIIKAAEQAKKLDMKVITLTGKRDSALAGLADIDISPKGGSFADRAQELHIKIIHILIEQVERSLFPENYQ